MARGTPSEPILFTSAAPVGEREAGDWGGVVIQGRAPTNREDAMILEGFPVDPGYFFGGAELNDDSGVMTYVRIEYAGTNIQTTIWINALTLAGVSAGTEIHHVMVAHTLDDCFEWFGGTVDTHHLVAFNCGDGRFV